MPRRRKPLKYTPVVPPMERIGWEVAHDRESMTYRGKRIRLSVHLHIDEPGKWFVSCYQLGIEKHRLEATSLEAAAHEGLVYAAAMVLDHKSALEEANNTLSESLKKALRD